MLPLTTSSYLTDEVVAYRKQKYEEGVLSRGDVTVSRLNEFHQFSEPDKVEWGVLMNREDSATVSISNVSIRDKRVQMTHRQVGDSNQVFQCAMDRV